MRKTLIASLVAAVAVASAGAWYFWPDSDDRPIALVNADAGKSGQQLVDALQQAPDFTWTVATEDDADSADYAAAVRIPEDFTAALDSAQTADPRQASVVLSGNSTVLDRLSDVVSDRVDARAIDAALGGMAAVRSSLGQLTLGTQFLTSGVGAAKAGSGQFASGVAELSGYLAAAKDGSDQLAGAIDQLDSVVGGATAEADELAAGLSSTGVTVGQVRENADLLSSGLTEAIGLLRSSPLPLTPDQQAGVAKLDGLQGLAARTGEQLTGLDSLLGRPVDPSTDLGALLKTVVGQLTSASSQLSAGADELSSGLARLADEGGAQLDDASTQLSAGITQLDGVSTTLSDQVARILAATPNRSKAQQSAVAETLASTITVTRA